MYSSKDFHMQRGYCTTVCLFFGIFLLAGTGDTFFYRLLQEMHLFGISPHFFRNVFLFCCHVLRGVLFRGNSSTGA